MTTPTPPSPDGWDFSPGMRMRARQVADAFGAELRAVHDWAEQGWLATVVQDMAPDGPRWFSRQQVDQFLTPPPDCRWDFSRASRMHPSDVAAACVVNRRTVARWAEAGTLAYLTYPNGRRVHSCEQVMALLAPPLGCSQEFSPGALMEPRQAAKALGVLTKTLAQRASTGSLCFITLPGGHRRYSRRQITDLSQAPARSNRSAGARAASALLLQAVRIIELNGVVPRGRAVDVTGAINLAAGHDPDAELAGDRLSAAHLLAESAHIDPADLTTRDQALAAMHAAAEDGRAVGVQADLREACG